MANFGVSTEELKRAKANLPQITLSSFIDPRQNWVLVEDGNLLGFFGWVPRRLRVGKWSRLALPTLVLVMSCLWSYRPKNGDLTNSNALQVDSYPDLYSIHWWHNTVACIFMFGLVTWIMIKRSKGPLFTYTLLSWKMNALRSCINALAPFLHDNHTLLRLNRVLRFPALVSASITSSIWNFILLPYVYTLGLDTKEKKKHFLEWNFNFRMVQLHVCNIIYALLNTVVTMNVTNIEDGEKVLFDSNDLWYGAAYTFMYGLFYTMILDRIGVHIYPVFSPRSNLVVITWCIVFALHYAFYCFWNNMVILYIEFLQFETLLPLNICIVTFGGTLQWFLGYK